MSIVYRRVGWKYVLEEDYWFPVTSELRPTGLVYGRIEPRGKDAILIRAGYAWDGASGPTLDTKDTMEPSLVHDVLYQLMREGCVPQSARQAADKLLRVMLRAEGMPYLRRWMWYWLLRWFGGKAAQREDT